MFRALITGSDDWDRPLVVAAVLAELRDLHDGFEVIYARQTDGAEHYADRWAARHGVAATRWNLLKGERGWDAERRRDTRMLEAGADLCVAFTRGGFQGLADRAEEAGIPTIRYDYDEPHLQLFRFEVYAPEEFDPNEALV